MRLLSHIWKRPLLTKILYFTAGILISISCFGQKLTLPKQTNDTNEIVALNKLGLFFTDNNQLDSAALIFRKSLFLAQRIKNNKFEAFAYYRLGTTKELKEDNDSAVYFLLKALPLYKKIGIKDRLARIHLRIGNAYAKNTKYAQALMHMDSSLKINKELNEPEGQSFSLNGMALVFKNQGDLKTAVKYFRQVISINLANNLSKNLPSSYSNLALTFYDLKELDSALYYQKLVLKTNKLSNNEAEIGGSYLNIALTQEAMNNVEEAKDNYENAKTIFEKTDDKYGLSLVYLNLGSLFQKEKNYDLAKQYFLKSIAISKAIGDIDGARLCYKSLSEVAEVDGNYKDAYNYFVNYTKLQDSIFNAENSKQLGDLKTQFEVEKKEAELKIQAEFEKDKLKAVAKEKQLQQNIIISAIIGILLVVSFFSILLYRRFNEVKKQKNIIELKEQETSEQKLIIEEKQREIIDSLYYARRIQQAMLPNEMKIEKSINSD